MAAPPRLRLFIALDGVLRPHGGTPLTEGKQLVHMPRLSAVMRAYEHVDLVINDPMHATHTLEQIKAFFPAELRHRIEGATSVHQRQRDSGGQEVSFYRRGDSCPNIIVDWDTSRYASPVQVEQSLVLTNPATGLDRKAEIQIRSMILWKTGIQCWLDWAQRFHRARDAWPVPPVTHHCSAWQPAMVTCISDTLEAERAVQSGALARHLFRGIGRVYLSQMAMIRRPQLRPVVATLASQFPERLEILPLEEFAYAMLRKYYETDPDIAEHFLLGHQMKNQLRDDWKDGLPESTVVVSLGKMKRKEGMRYGWPLDLDTWDRLSTIRIDELAQAIEQYKQQREEKAIEMLQHCLSRHSTAADTQ